MLTFPILFCFFHTIQTPVYSIISFEPGTTYFAINPSTGGIFIRRDLRTDPAYLTFYRFVLLFIGAMFFVRLLSINKPPLDSYLSIC